MRKRTLPKLLLTFEVNGDPVAYEIIDRPDLIKSVQKHSSTLVAILEEARRNIDPSFCGVEIRGRASRDRAWIEFAQNGRRIRLVLDVDWPEDGKGND